jgi:hypothetical protein
MSRSAHASAYGAALIDGGSNGGLAGSKMCVIETYIMVVLSTLQGLTNIVCVVSRSELQEQ